jgi:hypothetical protein
MSVPVHRDGRGASHPSQREVKHAGGARGLRSRLQMLKPGVATPID